MTQDSKNTGKISWLYWHLSNVIAKVSTQDESVKKKERKKKIQNSHL